MGVLDDTIQLKAWAEEFGARGATAALDELMQLHVMDTWTAMDLSKLM
jgi:hypothetical protein